MTLLRLRCFFTLLLLPVWLTAAPGAVSKGAVTAELVAINTSIQPGQPFRVALKLNHKEHWHTYWINPGTGYPTSLHWKLPDGFTAGPIQWPTPHVVRDTRGQITGHGYEKEVFLYVEITPPATLPPGVDVTLRAQADWLMCEDVCMPVDANLELTLPVDAGAPKENTRIARLFNHGLLNLPQVMKNWRYSASHQENKITLRLTPGPGESHRPEDLHFFDNVGLIDYAAPQVVTNDHDTIVITMTVSSAATEIPARLTGVLAAANGWSPSVGYGGAIVDVVFDQPTPVSSPVPTANPTPPIVVTTSLFSTLLLALVGGLILNLMPCVFPVLGIKVLGFVHQAGNDRSKVIGHGLIFSLGVLVSFWALAGLLLALRSGGAQLGWGFQLQSPEFVFGMTAFLLVFALNLSGLFEIGLSATSVGGKLQMQQGYGGSFFTGILATLVATPCSAPFLAPALGAALALPPLESLLVFTAIAVGLAAPYLILSLFPAAVKFLPRPGAWMETFKQLMAFPLYGTVGWLLWVLAGQTKDNDSALLLITFALVIIAMAAWVYGRFGSRVGRVVAALLLGSGIWLGWPHVAPATTVGYNLKWEQWSPEAVAAARTAGRTLYIDFTARWCATCQTNKAAVFTSSAVLAELEKRNVLLLKADWTSKDAAITNELAKWNRSAVPFNLIYAPGQTEPVVLPELLTPGIVLEALASLR